MKNKLLFLSLLIATASSATELSYPKDAAALCPILAAGTATVAMHIHSHKYPTDDDINRAKSEALNYLIDKGVKPDQALSFVKSMVRSQLDVKLDYMGVALTGSRLAAYSADVAERARGNCTKYIAETLVK